MRKRKPPLKSRPKPQPREATPLTRHLVQMQAGEPLSVSFRIDDGTIRYLVMPDEWTPAYLSFQVSFDNQIWHDLFDGDNREVQIDNPLPGTAIALEALHMHTAYFRLRSGLRNGPVAQAADRTFTVAVS
jgi:hypothetical protein